MEIIFGRGNYPLYAYLERIGLTLHNHAQRKAGASRKSSAVSTNNYSVDVLLVLSPMCVVCLVSRARSLRCGSGHALLRQWAGKETTQPRNGGGDGHSDCRHLQSDPMWSPRQRNALALAGAQSQLRRVRSAVVSSLSSLLCTLWFLQENPQHVAPCACCPGRRSSRCRPWQTRNTHPPFVFGVVVAVLLLRWGTAWRRQAP